MKTDVEIHKVLMGMKIERREFHSSLQIIQSPNNSEFIPELFSLLALGWKLFLLAEACIKWNP